MNSAVINPQAIKAPMFGITMPLKNRPTDWTPTFKELPDMNIPPSYVVIKLSKINTQVINAPMLGGLKVAS